MHWALFAAVALAGGSQQRLLHAADDPADALAETFPAAVEPFLQTYCVECHAAVEPEGGLNLEVYTSLAAVLNDAAHLDVLLERLKAEEMPPAESPQPSVEERRRAVQWFQSLRDRETQRNVGDPGVVLARRLSNAEYNYTIRDLTGVDIQPTREFPVDPANTAGFDNSGESLAMSPALLSKYLQAARNVADHMYLKPEDFAFAPHPMLAETDRDKYCVHRIINFYHRFNTNYADYFEAAWRYKHRAALGQPDATLADVAAERGVSAKYLSTIWRALEGEPEEVGPLAKLQQMWRDLPAPRAGADNATRDGCEQMRKYVVQVRKKVEPRFRNITAGSLNPASQPFLIWKNVQYATHRLKFDPAQLQVDGEPPPEPPKGREVGADGDFGPGHTRLIKNKPGDPDLAVPAGQRAQYEAAFAKFCSIFPDKFTMQERGRNYFDTSQDRGRYLSAGFHSLMGYFRDDMPLYELILDEREQRELDAMWFEMDFIAAATERMFTEYYAGGMRQIRGRDNDDRSAGKALVGGMITSEGTIKQFEAGLLERASRPDDENRRRYRDDDDDDDEEEPVVRTAKDDEVGIQAIKDYCAWINETIRRVEKARLDAEPSHLRSVLDFASRAYRRPLTQAEQDDLLAFYHAAREEDALSHEAAVRECIVAVLMSPDYCYRIDLVPEGEGVHALSDYDLASRLSFFLWSSAPDAELLAHAAAGDLHEPEVLKAQARRMINDPRIRALAVEFGGNWLDYRRFEELNTVDRERFEAFDDELRTAMFEEPVRLLVDVFQRDRPVLDLLYANDTFVNPALAKHYGMETVGGRSTERGDDDRRKSNRRDDERRDDDNDDEDEDERDETKAVPDPWTHIADARPFGRGGLLPMAVFLTKNSPGLRTSPVKRGNWVVKNVLGERIPPPPPTVPELPQDEAKLDLPLREVLARHRADPSCAACHARFDSFGLAFEGFGPIGERRELDLAGRAVDVSATFPDGSDGAGLEGLQKYIREQREQDFVDNMSGKMVAYALGRSLMLSDEKLIHEMREKLASNDYRFGGMIECVVTSPQFLTKRGREGLSER